MGIETEKEHHITYEYKEITADGEKAAMYQDCYRSFGWEKIGENDQKLMFRRSRKIMNRAELTRLQRNFEACMKEIDELQKSKTAKATAVCIGVGIAGTAFMAGSVFAVTASPPVIWLCVLLAIPAFALWILAPLLYPRMVKKRTESINELIENKYNEIYEVCEKGDKLLL